MHDEKQTERHQREQDVSPKICPDNFDIPDTYTYPVKIMAVTQGTLSTIQIEGPYIVARGAVDVSGWTSECDEEMILSEFCAEKLQSTGEVEVSKLLDLGGDSVAELLVQRLDVVQLRRLDHLICMLEICTLKCIEGGADCTRGLTGRQKYYPSQSTKIMLKNFFETNLPAILCHGETTTSFSPDQMVQFARAVGLEVTLASYALLEELKLQARVVGGLGVREQ